MLNEKLYVNYVTLENSIKNNNLMDLYKVDRLATVRTMSDLLCGLYVRSLTDSEAKKDKYSIPMYAYAIIIADKDTLYFIDEISSSTRNDAVSFMGGQLMLDNLYKRYIKFDEDVIQTYLRYELLSNTYCQCHISGDDLLRSVNDFTIFKYKMDTGVSPSVLLDITDTLKFNYVKYIPIGMKHPGLYIFAPIWWHQLSHQMTNKLPYTRQQHRIAMNEYKKGRWTKNDFDRLVKISGGVDARFNQIELIDSIFNSLT